MFYRTVKPLFTATGTVISKTVDGSVAIPEILR